MPETRIRILHVEDVPADAELAERELRRAGLDFEILRVETKDAFLAAIRDFRPGLILSDYRLPNFDGMQALLLAREHAPDVPVVITTGSVNEETAVACMRAGAADYVLKEHLGRLGTAVRSALERQRLETGRRQAERALLESEDRYHSLFATSLDAVLLTTPEGQILAANAAACRMFGRSEEELIRVGRAGVIDGSDPALASILEERARTGAYHGEMVLLRRDRTRFTGEISSVVFTDRHSQARTSMVIRDVTGRKAAEERNRRLNRLLKTITEVDSLLIKVADEASLLEKVCRVLVETGGYRLAWIGKADAGTMRAVPLARFGAEAQLLDSIVVRWDDSPEGRGPFGTAIRTGRHVVVQDAGTDPIVSPWSVFRDRVGIRSMAVLPLRRGGAVNAAVVAYAAVPAFIDEEETALLDSLAGNISFALDVLDDRERARRVDVELRKLWRAVEQTPATVVITDLEGKIEYVNPKFTEVTGYSAEEARGQNPRILKSDRTEPVVYESLWRTIAAGGTWQGELCNKKKDGTLFWEKVSISPVRDERGIVTHYVAVKEDITAQRSAAEELEKTRQQLNQSQKMEAVGRLAGGVAHDFNNLLTVIQGYGELLAPSLEGDPDLHGSVIEIVKAAGRASALTRQLLAFSRQQVLEMRVIDVGAIVADLEKMLRRLIGENIEVVVVKPAGLGHVKADPGQIEQVVINLAVNSRDAMPDGGRLTLRLEDAELAEPLATPGEPVPPGRYVVLSVADTGTGMDEATLGHIFEPFFTTKEKGKGTGLGLATVYGIVRQTGGYVAVETAPGGGTTFRIYLPRCTEVRASGIRPSFLPRNGTETVLIAEDEVAIRTLAKAVLERRGYSVIDVESAEAAIELVSSDPRPIHVLLTDVILPKRNGLELASRLSALRPSLKVLFMSGYTAEILKGHDLKSGQAFITKPFSAQGLAAKVREVLDTPAD